MKNSTDLEGHRALVEYKYGLADLCIAIIGTAMYMFAVFGTLALMGCGTESAMHSPSGTPDASVGDGDGGRGRGLSEFAPDVGSDAGE